MMFCLFENKWQGRLDSNQRMPRSKPGALPLGDAPIMTLQYDLKVIGLNSEQCKLYRVQILKFHQYSYFG